MTQRAIPGELPAGDVVQAGTYNGESWEMHYIYVGGKRCIRLVAGEAPPIEGCGFEIPEFTEVGYNAQLKPGEGAFYLFGLTSSRIATVEARSKSGVDSKVDTRPLEVLAGNPNDLALRTFVITREPVDDVAYLVGLDSDGEVIQELPLNPDGKPSRIGRS